MIFISGIISIIIQKNTLCTNKFGVTYFCPNWVICLPENAHFSIFFFLKGGRLPPYPPARTPMTTDVKSLKLILRSLCRGHFQSIIFVLGKENKIFTFNDLIYFVIFFQKKASHTTIYHKIFSPTEHF